MKSSRKRHVPYDPETELSTIQVAVPLKTSEVRPADSNFPWVLAICGCSIISFVVLAQTLRIPFFLSDDGVLFKKAHDLMNQVREGHLLAGFNMPQGEARYFPGIIYYQWFRIALMGSNAVLWHIFHILLYAAIGVQGTWICWKLTRSIVPGLAAFTLLVGTGEVQFSSNYWNMIATNTFEPPLMFMWLATACLLAGATSLRKRAARFPFILCALFFASWSSTIKETTFLIMGAVAGASLIILAFVPVRNRDWKRLANFQIVTLLAILLFSFFWGIHVVRVLLKILPRDNSYGGMGSLALSPTALWTGLVGYKNIMLLQADYVLHYGLILLIARFVLNRKNWSRTDLWLLFVIFAGFCQLLTVAIWPLLQARLCQPAYFAFLLVACCEIWRWGNTVRSWVPEAKWWRIVQWALLLGLPLGLRWFNIHPERLSSLFSLYCLLLVIAGAVAVFWRRGIHPFILTLLRRGVIFSMFFSGVVVLLQSANLLAFMITEYDVREGVRNKAQRYAAKYAAPGARVFWVVFPDNEGHAWSSKMNFDYVMNRPDLTAGPASWVATQGRARKGDIIINHTGDSGLNIEGNGHLAQTTLNDGGPFLSLRDARDVRRSLTSRLYGHAGSRKINLEYDYAEYRMPLYVVISDYFDFSQEFARKFLGRK